MNCDEERNKINYRFHRLVFDSQHHSLSGQVHTVWVLKGAGCHFKLDYQVITLFKKRPAIVSTELRSTTTPTTFVVFSKKELGTFKFKREGNVMCKKWTITVS